jgi:hypothetical protein
MRRSGSPDVDLVCARQEARFEEAASCRVTSSFDGDEQQLFLMYLDLRRHRRQHPYYTVYMGHPAGPRAVRLPSS